MRLLGNWGHDLLGVWDFGYLRTDDGYKPFQLHFQRLHVICQYISEYVHKRNLIVIECTYIGPFLEVSWGSAVSNTARELA